MASFGFNGFLPLQPFIAWAPAHLSQDQRVAYLTQLDLRLRSIDTEKPLVLPPQSDFPDWGKETKKRFMVTVSHAKIPDNHYQALVPEEIKQIAELKRQGVLLSSCIGNPSMSRWNAFLLFRENSVEAVREHLKTLPLVSYLNFVVTELMQS
jgi:muconolactone delta-isomerase